MKKIKNYIAVEVERLEGDAGNYKEVKINIPNDYDVITGLAVFIEEQPEEITDFKIAIRETKQQHFDLISKKVFEAGLNVAPNDKFATIDIPTDKSKDLYLGVKLPIAVPAGKKFKISASL